MRWTTGLWARAPEVPAVRTLGVDPRQIPISGNSSDGTQLNISLCLIAFLASCYQGCVHLWIDHSEIFLPYLV